MIGISSSLGLENLTIVTSYRLGKKVEGKIRPLKIVLDSKAQRKFLLDNAKDIITKAEKCFQRVIIVKDLTPEQRQERRERVQNTRRNQRIGVDSARVPVDKGAMDSAGASGQDVITMEIDARPLSPILAGGDDLSQFNRVISESETESPYDNTTLLGDETIRGGFDTQGGRLEWPPPVIPEVPDTS